MPKNSFLIFQICQYVYLSTIWKKLKFWIRQLTSVLQNYYARILVFIFLMSIRFSKNKNLQQAVKMLYSLYDQGYSVMDILDNYFLFIKSTPLIDETNKYKITKILCKYMTIFIIYMRMKLSWHFSQII